MENKRGKMDRKMRAKQFLPFSAVKGLEEVLREKERLAAKKLELEKESFADVNTREIKEED